MAVKELRDLYLYLSNCIVLLAEGKILFKHLNNSNLEHLINPNVEYYFDPQSKKTCLWTCTPSEDSNQTAHSLHSDQCHHSADRQGRMVC